jgi:SAM-dependent methyltransferase
MNSFSYIVKALLRRGAGFIFLYARESLAFDLFHGTNTHLRVPKAQPPGVGADFHDGVLYVASFTSVVCRTLAVAESAFGEAKFREAQFFDLGCGKGKALLVYAMRYGRRARQAAVGIEYEPTLCEIARSNARKLKLPGQGIEVHCDSALNIGRYIKSANLVIYLYNPFGGQTLRSVLAEIAKYRHVLIYVDPVERGLLFDFGYEVIASRQGRHHADTWLVASSRGAGGQPGAAGVGAT